AYLLDQPRPEGNGLRVRVVDAEAAHSARHPVEDDVAERVPEPQPFVAVEVQVVDVLVALGRVLGVLERAVRAPVEPLGVLGEPGVARGAVKAVVDADLTAELAPARHEPLEVLDRPELGVDAGVASIGAADRPRAADVALLRVLGVVLALAVGEPD